MRRIKESDISLEKGASGQNAGSDSKAAACEYNNWSEISWNGQGDTGEWALLYKDGNNSKHLVLYCEWGFHYSNVFCGNVLTGGGL